MISLHVSLSAVGVGGAGGVVAGLATVALALRALKTVTPRRLVMGQKGNGRTAWRRVAGMATALVASVFWCAAFYGKVDPAVGFFGAGTLLLIAVLLLLSFWLERSRFAVVQGYSKLGLRSLAYHPGRSILCIALIASATFTIVSLDTFRREGPSEAVGSYPLFATSELPLAYDPNSPVGRDALNLAMDIPVEFVSFRMKPGDDASCLNLYRPLNPRIIAPPPDFLHQSRFAFQGALSKTDNPWLLLEGKLADGVIPAIADANSMTYTMHLKLGEEFLLNGARYKIVAALQDSIFQGELLISEMNFLRLFPGIEGYRLFLMKGPEDRADQVARDLEEALSDYGFVTQRSAARLAGFHRVENTYLSTFQALGGLGLLLGTVGLAAVLLRNVLERRKELALLRAVGYRPEHIAAIVLLENASLLMLGLTTGAACALLALVPAVSVRGGHLPVASLARCWAWN
jgi:putative ABC transport system permease protein